MTYLLFLDDSGHAHNDLPYEVRGGVVVPEARLGALTDRCLPTIEHRPPTSIC